MAINGLLYESGVYATTGDLAVAGGLVYVTGSTFSASSAVNVNNCFTSTYENYRVIVSFTSAVGGGAITMRLRASGTDDSGANYNQQRSSVGGTGYQGVRSTGQTSWLGMGSVSGLINMAIELFRPFTAATTGASAKMGRGTDTSIDMDDLILGHTQTTSYDGFSLIFASAATGNVRVYGYRNS